MRALSFAVAAVVLAPVLSAQTVQYFSKEPTNRAVLGISTTSGGPRDTIGVLIADVTTGGPADKAGIQEGDRIASIDDVELRLAPADATDSEMRGIMARRLAHALAKRAPGDVVVLRVFHDGQFATRKVTTGKAADVFVMPAVSFGTMFDQDPGQRVMERLQRVHPLPPLDSSHFELRLDTGPHRI
jgi:S1-C subfamily serine protease